MYNLFIKITLLTVFLLSQVFQGVSLAQDSVKSVDEKTEKKKILAQIEGADKDKKKGKAEGTNSKEVIADMSVPDSPAFTVLGLTPHNVIAPSSPRDLAVSLLNGMDKNGNFQSGVAIDTSFLNLARDKVTITKYRKYKYFYRTQISIATTKGSESEDKAHRLALGFRLTLLDYGDPRDEHSPLTTCYAGMVQNLKKDLPVPDLEKIENDFKRENHDISIPKIKQLARFEFNRLNDAYEPAWESRAAVGMKNCQKTYVDRHWNSSRWDVGFAPSWISENGSTQNMRYNGGGIWTSFAIGPDLFMDKGERANWEEEPDSGPFQDFQLILHARHIVDEKNPDPDVTGSFLKQNASTLGARLVWGITSTFGLSFESSYVHSDPYKSASDNSFVYTLGVNLKLTDGIWLEATAGTNSDRDKKPNEEFVLASLKWAFTDTPKFTPNNFKP